MPRSVHPTYLCPNCLKPAHKDQPLHVLLANLSDPNTLNYSDAKTLPAPLRRLRQCTSCQGTLDLAALANGQLDYQGWGVRIGALAAAAAFAGLLALDKPLEITTLAFLTAGAGLLTWFAVDTAERSRIARFRKTVD